MIGGMFRDEGYPMQTNKVDGVMLGVVTNNQDPEKLGRVKLKFPLREGEEESGWARVATLMGGKERGSLFVPEVGDEVLVAFLLGEFREPYVIGALWNQDAAAPEGNEKNDLRRIVSRAGHVLEFDDKENEGKVTVKTKKGHVIEMAEKDDQIKVSDPNGKNTITITAGDKNEIVISASQSTITLNGKGEIEIKGSKSVKMSGAQVNIEASGTMDIKAGGALNIKSDGMIAIKGSLVKIN